MTIDEAVSILQACLSLGWDVICPEECALSRRLWRRLMGGGKKAAGLQLTLRRGEVLHLKDHPCRQFQVLLSVRSPRSGHSAYKQAVIPSVTADLLIAQGISKRLI